MKLVILSAAVLMLAALPAEAGTVTHRAGASHATHAHVSKVSDEKTTADKKPAKKAKHHKAKHKAKHTS